LAGSIGTRFVDQAETPSQARMPLCNRDAAG
jgi:hypothetical protein